MFDITSSIVAFVIFHETPYTKRKRENKIKLKKKNERILIVKL